ncbi:T9SS type A sorting domain-containing protein [bacterium]|nr:T9SS type A sorting domain-containing protein [bacterium]
MKYLIQSVVLLLLFFFPRFAAGDWTEVGELPTPRSGMASAVLGDTLYLIGGSVPGTSIPVASSDVVRFSLEEELLLGNAPSLNTPRVGASAVTYDGAIIVFGGRRNDIDYVAQIEAWRPGDAEWTVLGELTPARAWASALVKENVIYVAGGTSGSGERHRRIDLVVPYLDAEPPYAAVSALNDSLPSSRSHHAMIEFNGSIYLFGGYSVWPLSDCYRWDDEGWIEVSSMAQGVSGMAVSPFRHSQTDLLVASGGRSLTGEVATHQLMGFNENWGFANDLVLDLPLARSGHVIAPLSSSNNRVLYVFGGSYINTSGQQVILDDILTFTSNNTSTVNENRIVQPGSLHLAAHPNPSNGAVTISIVPSSGSGDLNVRIFDLLGREVKAWHLPASRSATTLSWDGSEHGREVTGGIYFLVARSGDQQQVLKLFRLP